MLQNERKNSKQQDHHNDEAKEYRYTSRSRLRRENNTFIISSTKSPITHCQQEDEGSDSSRPSISQPTPFPWKLHDLLDDGQEAEVINAAISWLPSGKGFRIHNRKMFTEYVLPRYFQIQYKSFIRQLNIYGFKRVVSCGADGKGAYTHDCLIRGQPSLCRNMKRTKIKRKGNGNGEKKKSLTRWQQDLKTGGQAPPGDIPKSQSEQEQPTSSCKSKCSTSQEPLDAKEEEEPSVFDETQTGCSITNVKEALQLKTCFPRDWCQNQQSIIGMVDSSITTMPSSMLEVTSEHESMLHETRSISITHDVETAIIDTFFGGAQLLTSNDRIHRVNILSPISYSL